MAETINVYILDGVDRVNEATTITEAAFVEEDLAVGAWKLSIAQSDAASKDTIEAVNRATWLGVEAHNPNTGWTYAGPASYKRRTYRNGTVTGLDLRGPDFMDIAASYLDWPNNLNVSDWWIPTGDVDSLQLSVAAGNTIGIQAGGNALTERQVPDLAIEDPPAPFGQFKNWQSTGQTISELFKGWYEDDPDYTYRVELHRTPGVAQAVIRFRTTERLVAPFVVSPGAVGDIDIIEVAAETTTMIAMGDYTGDTDFPDKRHVGLRSVPETGWKTRRRERFVNRPSANFVELDNEIASELAESGTKTTANIPGLTVPDYGVTTRLGDLVTVNYDNNEDPLLVPVGSSTLTYTRDEGWKREVAVGKDVPIGPRQLAGRIDKLQGRLRRLEGFI